MSEGLDKIASVFLDEANDLLDKLEDYLLELEQNPEDMDTISAVFRSMHTIKGSAGMFGFDDISHFTHEAETAFDEVRNGRVSVSSELITLTLQARDHIRNMLHGNDSAEMKEQTEKLIKDFQVYLLKHEKGSKTADADEQETDSDRIVIQPDEEIKPVKAQPAPVQAIKTEEEESTWRITFKPSLDIFMNGTKPLSILAELADMGETSIIPYLGAIPNLQDIDPGKCYMSWDIILTTTKTEDDIKDVFIFIDSTSQISIQKLTDPDVQNGVKQKKLGEILLEKQQLTQEDISSALGDQKHIGTLLTEKNIVSKEAVQAALVEQKHIEK